MTSGNTNVTLDEQKNKRKYFRKRLNIFLICFFISAVMWLMIRLSRDYTQPFRFSVFYKGIQKNNILMPTSDTVIFVNVQTSGFNIIYNRVFPKKYKINIDISQYTPKLNKKFFEINIESISLSNSIASFFKVNEKIISILPANLKVKLEKAYSKKVPVIADVDISFGKQYNLYNKLILEPDSVYVTGNKNYIDTLRYVKTEKKSFKNLSTNTLSTLHLINPLSKYTLRYSIENVKLIIQVAQFTENSMELPIHFDTLSDNYQLITYPEKVTVYYLVAIPDYNKVIADSFNVGVNEHKLLVSQNNIAKVEIKKSPSFVKIQRIEPASVEFLIRKK